MGDDLFKQEVIFCNLDRGIFVCGGRIFVDRRRSIWITSLL